MQSRIDRLEGLVLSLMGSNAQVPGRNRGRSDSAEVSLHRIKTDDDDDQMRSIQGDGDGHPSGAESDDEVEEVRSALGIMKVERGESFYRGETHWVTLLSEVC
jgi:hypothetical protein